MSIDNFQRLEKWLNDVRKSKLDSKEKWLLYWKTIKWLAELKIGALEEKSDVKSDTSVIHKQSARSN